MSTSTEALNQPVDILNLAVDLDRIKNTLIELSHIGFNESDKGIYRL